MREIKYRVYVLGKMYTVKQLIWDDRLYIVTDSGFVDANDEHVVLMQYIGIKDKNNKEIYEGDIVKQDRFDDLNGEFTGVIKFGFKGFHIYMDQMSEYYYLEFSRPLEIIGNIHENPELLTIN